MKLLVTGGAGFLGSNLVFEAIRRDYDVKVIDNLSRVGSKENLSWLQSNGTFSFEETDIRNADDVNKIVQSFQPDVVFHLAGQVAMTTSLEQPLYDFHVNSMGTIHILEAVRMFAPDAAVFYSSTNKVYGDLEDIQYSESKLRYITPDFPKGFPESLPFECHSPYGCSKGSADQYMQDYFRMFGIKTVVFRHSSMYGSRQYGTVDQGWISWFCQQALEFKNGNINELSISGTGKQVRDVLFVDDMISLYFESLNNLNETAGNVYNIGGGVENSLSLLELFDLLNEYLNINLVINHGPKRSSDQDVFIADISKINRHIGWAPKVTKEDGISQMLTWVLEKAI